MRLKIFTTLLFLSLTATTDRGSIPFNPDVQIFEPHKSFVLPFANNNVGQTTIDLIVITSKLLSYFPALPISHAKLMHSLCYFKSRYEIYR